MFTTIIINCKTFYLFNMNYELLKGKEKWHDIPTIKKTTEFKLLAY